MKDIKLTEKSYKIENAPVGSRFLLGSHSTLMIVTDLKEISTTQRNIVCVSENGLIEKISYGTEIFVIKEVKPAFISLSLKITRMLMEQEPMKATTKIKSKDGTC